tara:strand:+ start:41 stop:937 length:897 start_codon:yes stop_codon:yes gene_type:complete
MALADFIPAGTPIVGGPANPSQMQTVQRVPNVTPTANTPLSTTGSFLDQLQESAGLLSNQVANVGNYTPRFASDYITTPFGEPIAKNQFVGNDFLMPNLTGASYNPRGFNPIQGGQFNFGNLGTYNPGAFNQFYQAPMTSPAMAATTTTRASEGDGRERLGGFLSRNNLRSDLLNNRFVDIPEKYETTIPGLLGILDSIIGNVPREVAVDRIMRDIDASKDFGVNKFGLGTSYKGSSGIDRDPADFGTPTTGPAARDTDLGKGGNRSGGGGFGGDNTGGRDASGVGGTGGRRGGAGPN